MIYRYLPGCRCSGMPMNGVRETGKKGEGSPIKRPSSR